MFEIKHAFSCQIFHILKHESRHFIDRIVLSHSEEELLTITCSGIKAIAFLCHKNPPFDDNFSEWKRILTEKPDLNVRKIQIDAYSIHFEFNGFTFHISLAVDFVENPAKKGKIEEEHKSAFRCILHVPDELGVNGIESRIKFLEKQGAFVYEMLRITKFWFKTLHFNEQVPDSEEFLETVSIYAANLELSHCSAADQVHLHCFKRILDLIIDFDSLNITFLDEWSNSGLRTAAKRMLAVACPKVLDPVNPNNNLVKGFNDRPSMKSVLISYARRTQVRVDVVVDNDGSWPKSLDASVYVFQPQPEIHTRLPKSIVNATFVVSTSTKLVDRASRNIRNGLLNFDWLLLEAFNSLEALFVSFAELCKVDKECKLSDVREKFVKIIEVVVCKMRNSVQGVSNDQDQEDCEITFVLPVGRVGGVLISLKDIGE